MSENLRNGGICQQLSENIEKYIKKSQEIPDNVRNTEVVGKYRII